MDKFKAIANAVGDEKENFFEVTGFYEVPGAEIKHAFLGMLYAFISMAKGNYDNLKVNLKTEAPFFEVQSD